jgi:hypothetical protein
MKVKKANVVRVSVAEKMKADANKDGQVSKAEFMSKHEAMFNKADANKDGMLDAKEHKLYIVT